MKGYSINIEKATLANANFRKVLYTAKHSQLVLMSLMPKEEIGMETHEDNDQFFRFEKGQGISIINGNECVVGRGDIIIVPSGAKHNINNTSSVDKLNFYTLYSPPHHKDGIVRKTKVEAGFKDEKFDGVTTE